MMFRGLNWDDSGGGYPTVVTPDHGRTISYRADSKGGGIRLPPQPGTGHEARRRLIILVHGFNVDEMAAYGSFHAFEGHLATALGKERWENSRTYDGCYGLGMPCASKENASTWSYHRGYTPHGSTTS
jgi:hypothetical protein